MRRYRRLLPSTSRLVAFTAVAKAQNITAAADMLGLTQAAVSRQLRELEGFIGQPLAIRSAKGVSLTPAGERLFADLPSALDLICDAVEATVDVGAVPRITVFCDHSLTTSWLNRKILEFEKQHPEVVVQVLSSNRRPEDFAGQFDLAILYGRPETSTYESLRISSDRVFPVASPALLADMGSTTRIEDLLQFPLIDLTETRRDWLNWHGFLTAHGIEKPPKPKAKFDSYAIALEAARAGQGIVLGWELVLESDLAKDSLHPIGPWHLDSPGGLRVHFVQQHLTERSSGFINWLSADT
ncbi:MAG: LysR substrate-binding domain-containing protein [Pseudomonadota bacterium]